MLPISNRWPYRCFWWLGATFWSYWCFWTYFCDSLELFENRFLRKDNRQFRKIVDFGEKTNFYAVTIFFGNQVTNRKFVTVLLFLPPLVKFWLEPILLLPFSRPVRALRKTKICFEEISKNILQFSAWFEPPIQLVMVIPLARCLYIEFCFGLPEKIHVEVTIGITIERILWPNISFDLYSW